VPSTSDPLRTRRTVAIPAPADDVWAALERVDDYPTWWPWLRRFDAEALAAGQRWSCRIRPPLPWSLRFDVELRSVARGRVEAVVVGDIDGSASVDVRARGEGCTVTLDASLRAQRGPSAALHRLAPAASRWAHDRVVDAAFAQFRDRALGGRELSGPASWWRSRRPRRRRHRRGR